MKLAFAAAIAIILAGILASAYFYQQLPARIPTHWNAAGQVDGYMPKLWALSLLPAISIGLLALLAAVPRADPLKKNIRKFSAYYEGFIALILGFLLYIHLLTIAWALGYTYNIIPAISLAFAILWFYIGILLGKTKRNWFIGIRTPWTLSSDKVWDIVHKRGAKLFKASGILALAGVFAGVHGIWFIIIPVLASAVYLSVWSYFVYRGQRRGKSK